MPSLTHLLLIGILQGVSEFLPLSSSGHLALFMLFFKMKSPSLLFITVAHLGTLMSILAVYRSSLYSLKKTKSLTRNLLLIFTSLLPTALAGVFLKPLIDQSFLNQKVIGLSFILTGTYLFLTYFKKNQVEKTPTFFLEEISFFKAFIIGVSQIASLFPGISRSGVTISTALFLNIPANTAVFFSFLMAIPTLLMASVWELFSQFQVSYEFFYLKELLLIFLVSFLVGWVALKGLISFVKHLIFPWFAFYLWPLGIFVLLFSFV